MSRAWRLARRGMVEIGCTAVRWVSGVALVASAMFAGVSAEAQQAQVGQLFPEPFLVEHHLVQTLPDGGVFATEPVTDYYGGSRIVSVRGDGSRLVVDFARRELVEIRPERGTFSVLSFDRYAELTRSLRAVEGPTAVKGSEALTPGRGNGPEFRIEFSETNAQEGVSTKSVRLGVGKDLLVERVGVRRLEAKAFVDGSLESSASMVLWFDPHVRFSQRAQTAMEDFETTVVAGGSSGEALVFSRLATEARKACGGALAFRTRRPLNAGGASGEAGSMDDVALRVEVIDTFPADLLHVPEGLERALHPLEVMASRAEQEADLRAGPGASSAPRRIEVGK